MAKTAWQGFIQGRFAGMAEGCMPEIMPKRDRLSEVLIEHEGAGHRSRYLRHLQRMREACPIVVAFRGVEHLRLVLEPSESFAVEYPVAVPLIASAKLIGILMHVASA